MNNPVYKIYGEYDETLAMVEFNYIPDKNEIYKILDGFYHLYPDMSGWVLLNGNTKVSDKRYQETYYDGPEDNLHYINER
jgi:hypothetical protein